MRIHYFCRIEDYTAKGLYPSVPAFLDFQLHKIRVTFTPKDKDAENEFELAIHKNTKYDGVAAKVAQHVGADPEKLQFLAAGVNDEPKVALRRMPNWTLEDMLHAAYHRSAVRTKLFYDVLDISLAELELKRLVKVTLCSPTLKDTMSIETWMLKTARITDLLKEMETHGLTFKSENGTNIPRVYEAVNNRFQREFMPTSELSLLSETAGTQLYVEVK